MRNIKFTPIPVFSSNYIWLIEHLDRHECYIVDPGCAEEILSLGMWPFGLLHDNWYVCLDLRKKSAVPPISCFDMELQGRGRRAISKRPLFSSFTKMIECMTSWHQTGDILEFDAIDPGNNYRNAYDSWGTTEPPNGWQRLLMWLGMRGR